MKDNDLHTCMMLPTFMIYQSFRYVLGRRTGVVGMWVDWAINHWMDFPEMEKVFISRELDDAFILFSRDTDNKRKYLGDDCDIAYWVRLRKVINDGIYDDKIACWGNLEKDEVKEDESNN
uniref:Uncharacterized protein n=1 Tax=viral metagenome TaxID=1070528 RepID=A0A6M3IUB2_9ZZZZ